MDKYEIALEITLQAMGESKEYFLKDAMMAEKEAAADRARHDADVIAAFYNKLIEKLRSK
jgi:hypothetical protein